MSFQDWQYKQAEKHAHNEILSFFIIVIGTNLLTAGLIMTTITTGQPLFIPYPIPQYVNLPIALGLILTDSGFVTILSGFALAIRYDKQRTWHLSQIEKSTNPKNLRVTVQGPSEIMQELNKEKRRN